MKKKILTILCVITAALNLTACGQSAADEGTGSVVDSLESEVQQEKEEETSQDTKENEEELPYWEGVKDYFGYRVDFAEGYISMYLEYPSLKPTSYGWAYQKDATYIAVLTPGRDENYNHKKVDTLENTFAAAKESICTQLDFDRNSHYDNFDFIVETAEPVTINDLSMYKYTGIHTYTYDEEQRECDFVAYSVDTGQIEHTYPIIIVLDDTLSNLSSKDPVPEGTIEAYARKMAESITLEDYTLGY